MPTLPHRRRWPRAAAGILAGLLAGSIAGAIARPMATPGSPRARVLHAAPTLATPGVPVELRFAPVCEPVGTPACDLRAATLHVMAAGRWTDVPGTVDGGEATFVVPGELVAEDGFAYYAEMSSATGAVLRYPPAGARHPLQVDSTAGFSEIVLSPDLSLAEVRTPDGTALFLPWGEEPGHVGRTDGGDDRDPLGPSSFAVGPSGELAVADWVNERISVFDADGTYRELPLPERVTVDLAVGADGRIALVGLGMGARVHELSADGRPLGSYPVALGAPVRVVAPGDGPVVMIGPGQWVPVRTPKGQALDQAGEDAGRRASPDGALSQALADDRFAVAWPGPGPATVGVVVGLPPGINVGVDYFVQRLADGGALVARGLWDEDRMAVGLFRFSPSGELLDLSLLPEPSPRMDARFSTVRFRPPAEVLVAYDRVDGIAIERFEVTA